MREADTVDDYPATKRRVKSCRAQQHGGNGELLLSEIRKEGEEDGHCVHPVTCVLPVTCVHQYDQDRGPKEGRAEMQKPQEG